MKNILLAIFVLVISLSFSSAAVTISPYSSNPVSGSTLNAKSALFQFNISTPGAPLDTVIWNWNGTNYSLYDPSLVLAYNFDNVSALGENDTVVKDISRYGNNATVYGGANISWTGNGRYGGAFNWSGNVALVNASNPTSLQFINSSNNWTISLWYNVKDSANHFLLYKASAWAVELSPSGSINKIRFAERTGFSTYTSSDAVVSQNVWQHITITHNESNAFTIYLNGLPIGGTGTVNSFSGASSELDIGGRVGTLSMNGSIDDLRIYNRSLSASEVYDVWNNNLAKRNSTSFSFTANQSYLRYGSYSQKLSANDTLGNSATSQAGTFNVLLSNGISISNLLGQTNAFTYGANIHYFFSNQTFIDVDNDGTLETRSNDTWHKQTALEARLSEFRRDTSIEYYYQGWNGTAWNYTSSASEMQSIHAVDVQWAYNNGVKFLYIGGHTPPFLQNKTTGWCNVTAGTGTDNRSCSPTDYNLFGNMTSDFFYNITNKGQYQNVIEYECMNEPNSLSWLSNLSRGDPIKTTEIIKLCNATYTALRRDLPNITLVSPSVSFSLGNSSPMIYNIIGNLSSKFDALTYHSYSNTLDTTAVSDLRNVLNNYSAMSLTPKRIILGEFNYQGNATLTNASISSFDSFKSKSYASLYAQMLSIYPNLTFIPYQWTEKYPYSTYYPEFPEFYNMVYEPQMNTRMYYPSFNVTYNFARYAPAGSTIYNSSVSDWSVYTVVSKLASTCNVIITNAENDIVNVTLPDLSSLGCSGQLIDVETGRLYSSGENYGLIEPYGVIYLTTPTSNVINKRTYYYNYLDEVVYIATSDTFETAARSCDSIQSSLGGVSGLIVILGLAIVGMVGFGFYKGAIGLPVAISAIAIIFIGSILIVMGIFISSSLCSIS